VEAAIPQRSDQIGREGEYDMDWPPYRRRSVVECCAGWRKECSRVGTRFETLANNFLTFVKLTTIQRYRRILDPSDRP
jgi:hypothetical protein